MSTSHLTSGVLSAKILGANFSRLGSFCSYFTSFTSSPRLEDSQGNGMKCFVLSQLISRLTLYTYASLLGGGSI
jgi:hypothetical protein